MRMRILAAAALFAMTSWGASAARQEIDMAAVRVPVAAARDGSRPAQMMQGGMWHLVTADHVACSHITQTPRRCIELQAGDVVYWVGPVLVIPIGLHVVAFDAQPAQLDPTPVACTAYLNMLHVEIECNKPQALSDPLTWWHPHAR